MENKIDIKNYYLTQFDEFEKSLNGEKSSDFHKVRKDAISKFAELTFPTQKDEEWKYTNISSLQKHNFSPAAVKANVSSETINKFLFDKMEHSLLVFVNGNFSSELSKLIDIPKGVVIGSLAEALKNNNPIVKKHLGKYAENENYFFTTLSSAFTKDGAFIYVPDGKVVEDPIHIIFITKIWK